MSKEPLSCLGSGYLQEAGEGPLGTGWPVWRRQWVGRACPVTELPSLPAGPSARPARLPWEPGSHLQESHVRDSPSEASATGPSATIGAPVGSLTLSSLFSSSKWARALHPWPLWAGHCLAQASALSEAVLPCCGAYPRPWDGEVGLQGAGLCRGPWLGVEAGGASRPRVLLGAAGCWSWGDQGDAGALGWPGSWKPRRACRGQMLSAGQGSEGAGAPASLAQGASPV